MKHYLAIFLFGLVFHQAQARVFLSDYDETGRPLPPGVPRVVETNGQILFIDSSFTTKAYQQAAMDLLLKEANQVAKELQLPEPLPITQSNLVSAFIAPFGYGYAHRSVGNITTSNYWYNVFCDYKFTDVTIARFDNHCRNYAIKYQIPVSQLDTNAAYQLAKQWLTAVHMDVKALEQDLALHIVVDPYWNNVKLGELPKKKFTPLYYVWWEAKNDWQHDGAIASVELFLPTKTLLSLSVREGKYILRPPLVFTNLAELFPGQAAIVTNYPVKPIVVGSPDDLK